jgi:hypothetical protein
MPHVGKEISDYCLQHGIKNVVFLDRSARPAYQAFKTQWDLTQDVKERPSIYFVSPKLMEEHGVGDAEVKLFKEEHPYLTKATDQPTLVFDVCVKEGRTLENMTSLLESSGFKDVHFMVTATHDELPYFVPNKVMYPHHSLGCHLFGAFFRGEVGVERNGYSFLSRPVEGDRAANVRANRKEISDAVKDCYR